jgi:hypothetical protein
MTKEVEVHGTSKAAILRQYVVVVPPLCNIKQMRQTFVSRFLPHSSNKKLNIKELNIKVSKLVSKL